MNITANADITSEELGALYGPTRRPEVARKNAKNNLPCLDAAKHARCRRFDNIN